MGLNGVWETGKTGDRVWVGRVPRQSRVSGRFWLFCWRMKAIEKYGVRLRPMQAGDLERVRRWRNAPHVRKTMAFREHITPAMQAAWWRGLDPFVNFYFVIVYGGQDVGVVHAKDIDWEARTAETGIFMGKRAYLEGFVPVLAVLALMDGLFEGYPDCWRELRPRDFISSGHGGLERLRAKVRRDGVKVLDFNRRLGYVVEGDVEGEAGFLWLGVTREGYYAAARGLREMAGRVAGSEK
jgi:RimJ/RimL family protein N-acetyltransferase